MLWSPFCEYVQAGTQKEYIVSQNWGCSGNSEESLWHVTGTFCYVVELGANAASRHFLRPYWLPGPAVQSAIEH